MKSAFKKERLCVNNIVITLIALLAAGCSGGKKAGIIVRIGAEPLLPQRNPPERAGGAGHTGRESRPALLARAVQGTAVLERVQEAKGTFFLHH